MTDLIAAPADHANPRPYPAAADLPDHPTELAADLAGAWGYELDSPQITYGTGLWPYYRHGKPAAVRLAPDIAYRAWNTHDIVARPAGEDQVQLVLSCHAANSDDAVKVYVRLDLSHRRVVLPRDLPVQLSVQAVVKAKKVLALIDAACADRNVHVRPVTAEMRARAHTTTTGH
ncbi:hypothetical protein QEZ54_08500 [Catellatospora sp. KI3]|uniref:hypothetical protein n=1 Tax=Catellatospora sp. KI3 TaxID=3041620 RepID=UPI00248246A8|nr:hypothetical protein [Catellatospora sp. KI3]MDI1461001.1 hypothetical protein [Catellatospora sp. KI3]